MRAFFNHPQVRRARVVFRWCRIFVWLVVLSLVAAIAYLHLVGLPEFVKEPMLQRLQAGGVAADFSNMQLGWFRGPSVIIENAAFSRAHQPLSPRLTARRAELALNWDSLRHGQIELRFLQINGAQFEVPVSENSADSLLLNKVDIEMRFRSNDVVQLDFCRGIFHDVQLDIIGGINHAGALRDWKFPSAANTNGAWQEQLRQIALTLKKIQFSGKPILEIEAGADGRDPNSFHAELNFHATAARTSWGNATNLAVKAAIARLASPGPDPFLHMDCSAGDLVTPSVKGRKILLTTSFSRGANSNLDGQIQLHAAWLSTALDATDTNWLHFARCSLKGNATLAASNFVPLAASGKLTAAAVETPLGTSQEVDLDYTAARSQRPVPGEVSGPWAPLIPWTMDAQASLRDLVGPKLRLDRLAFALHWRAPQIIIENFEGDLYGGTARGGISLDVNSRELRAKAATDVNPHSVSQLLRPAGRNWLEQLAWKDTPRVDAELSLVLPPWTQRRQGWEREMESSLRLAGDFSIGPASFRKFPVDSAKGHFAYTNGIWNVTRLHVARPEGGVDMDYSSSVPTQNYNFVIDSHIDPKAFASLLGARQQRVTNEVAFPQPPFIHAEVRGCWRAPGRTAFTAQVRATNFLARGEKVAAFGAAVSYTNLVLTVRNLYVSNIDCNVREPWAQMNFGTEMVTLSNASGTVHPPLLQRVMRENPPEFLNHVYFDGQPSVSVSGSFSLTNSSMVDLHFLVNCGGLHYTNLAADRASGQVDYVGQRVSLTNIVGNLYGNGTLMGWLVFDSNPTKGSFFRADFTVRNIDLSAMVRGVSGKTNHLEGILDGDLTITGPDTSERTDWNGGGRIHVHDGMLWDIKIFGLFAPVLNAISPGWGHSRAREAVANFVITNGTVSSDDLEMVCTGFRLNFRGTVDKNKQLNLRMKATLSREMPILGPVLSVAFAPLSKMFEYKITGPLQDPVMEPVYVPRFVLFLLNPFKSSKPPAPPDPSAPPAGAKTPPP